MDMTLFYWNVELVLSLLVFLFVFLVWDNTGWEFSNLLKLKFVHFQMSSLFEFREGIFQCEGESPRCGPEMRKYGRFVSNCCHHKTLYNYLSSIHTQVKREGEKSETKDFSDIGGWLMMQRPSPIDFSPFSAVGSMFFRLFTESYVTLAGFFFNYMDRSRGNLAETIPYCDEINALIMLLLRKYTPTLNSQSDWAQTLLCYCFVKACQSLSLMVFLNACFNNISFWKSIEHYWCTIYDFIDDYNDDDNDDDFYSNYYHVMHIFIFAEVLVY